MPLLHSGRTKGGNMAIFGADSASRNRRCGSASSCRCGGGRARRPRPAPSRWMPSSLAAIRRGHRPRHPRLRRQPVAARSRRRRLRADAGAAATSTRSPHSPCAAPVGRCRCECARRGAGPEHDIIYHGSRRRHGRGTLSGGSFGGRPRR